MRDVQDWGEDDLKILINNKVEESINLDYKRSAALTKKDDSKNELAKDVSAFANSAGGRLIYGVIEERQIPIALDSGVDSIITREWIEQVINTRITPRVQGVIIRPILAQNGSYYFVIDVPQAGSLAPHQASDKKYYKRFNFQSVAMEDYEIKDIMRRSSKPHPVIFFSAVNTRPLEDGSTQFDLRIHLTNRANEPALYTAASIYVDDRLINTDVSSPNGYTQGSILNTSCSENGNTISVLPFNKNYSVPSHLPLFKEIVYSDGNFANLTAKSDGLFALGYRLSSPGFAFDGVGFIKVEMNTVIGIVEHLDLLNGDRV